MPSASLLDGIRFIREVSTAAHDAGYILALYGSVVINHVGSDVDVFAVPWRPDADYKRLIHGCRAVGYEQLGSLYFGLMRTCSAPFSRSVSAPIIDLQIREVQPPEPPCPTPPL
jgi:hypothetical protein